MKLLQINCVYKKDSTGKLVYVIHSGMLESGEESVVCYGRGEKLNDKNAFKTCGELYSKFNNLLSRFTGLMYGGCYFSTKKLIKIIKKQNPDIVHLHSINGYFVNIYKLIEFLNKSKIKTVLTLHAEFMHTANCGHALDCDKWKTGCGNCPRLKSETLSLFFDKTALSFKKMKKAFEGFLNLKVVSVSSWLKKRAEASPILGDKEHLTVLNGVDTSIFYRREDTKIIDSLKKENRKIVFHATAFFSADKEHLKGGGYVISLAKRFLKEDSNIVFLIAGKHDKVENLPSNVILLGNVTDQNRLAEYYSAADVTLLTSKKETFSMIVAESLCTGTPVVGFEAGAPEEITIKEYSGFVPFGDEDRIFEELKAWIYKEDIDKNAISNSAKSKYSKETMVEQYKEIYRSFL